LELGFDVMMIAKVISGGLGFMIGAVFLLAGLCKIGDYVSAEMHEQMKENFETYAKIWALEEIAPARSADDFRMAVGIAEIFCAIVLLLPRVYYLLSFLVVPLGFVVNWVLVVVMAGAVYTHHKLEESIFVPVVLLVFLLLYTIFAMLAVSPKKKSYAGETSTSSKVKSS